MAAAPPLATPGVGGRGRDLATRYPVALVTFGVLMFSTGPVMVAATSVTGPVFSF